MVLMESDGIQEASVSFKRKTHLRYGKVLCKVVPLWSDCDVTFNFIDGTSSAANRDHN